jgi:RNA polymerase-binding protein DksA
MQRAHQREANPTVSAIPLPQSLKAETFLSAISYQEVEMLSEKRVTTVYPPALPIKERKLSQLEMQIHNMLTEQLQSLTSKLEAQTSAMAQGTFDEGDYGDRATKSARQSKRLAMERLWQSMRTEVESAISRLEHGTYGLCEHCGVVIPEERLMAMPSAALCIDCARRQGQSRAN